MGLVDRWLRRLAGGESWDLNQDEGGRVKETGTALEIARPKQAHKKEWVEGSADLAPAIDKLWAKHRPTAGGAKLPLEKYQGARGRPDLAEKAQLARYLGRMTAKVTKKPRARTARG